MILRHNPKGGAPLSPNHYPLAWDKEGRMGNKLGYCENCGTPQILPIGNFDEIMDDLTSQRWQVAKALKKFLPKRHYFKEWLIHKLGGFSEIPEKEKELVGTESGYFRH